MEEHPEVGVLGGAVELIDESGKTLRPFPYPLQSREIKDALLSRHFPLAHPTVVMRKELFTSVGGYRGAFLDAEDYDLFLRMAERCELANLEAVVLRYRIHPNQISNRHMRQQAISMLAAGAAATSRRSGLPDPLGSVKEITPAVLAELGVMEEAVENTFLMAYQDRIIRSLRLSFDVPVLPLVNEMLAKLAESKHVQDSVAAAVWFAAARAYLSQHRLVRAVAAATRAFVIHPALAGDLARRGLRRLVQRARQVVGRI
jgi:DNA-binding transcriptional regulator YdaS (Cro superfamily)